MTTDLAAGEISIKTRWLHLFACRDVVWFRFGACGPGLQAKTTPALFSERGGAHKPLMKLGKLRIFAVRRITNGGQP